MDSSVGSAKKLGGRLVVTMIGEALVPLGSSMGSGRQGFQPDRDIQSHVKCLWDTPVGGTFFKKIKSKA